MARHRLGRIPRSSPLPRIPITRGPCILAATIGGCIALLIIAGLVAPHLRR